MRCGNLQERSSRGVEFPLAVTCRRKQEGRPASLRNGFSGPVMLIAALLGLAPLAAGGQPPATSQPGTALGRTPDRKPDLSGIWQVMNTADWDIQDHVAGPGVPAGKGVVEG